MPKPPNSLVKLRVAWGPIPTAGTNLRTSTGRTYLVMKVGGKTLHCLVLAPEEIPQGPVWAWHWGSR
jgi:hypothetical protein